MYVLLHAFSRRNAGDGLLADLALERLTRAGIPAEQCVLAAMDPRSFDDLPNVVAVPSEPWSHVSWSAVRAAAHMAATGVSVGSGTRVNLTPLGRLVRTAEGLVGLGGGYLRAGGPVEQAGCLLNHVPQLALAASAKSPSVYLPQSVGPLAAPVGALVRRLLQGIDLVYARDERTVSELGEDSRVVRMPDLAVLQLAERLRTSPQVRTGDVTVLVPRDLAHSGYDRSLRRLAAASSNVRWAVQASSQGPKDDAAHIRRLGGQPAGPLREVLDVAEGGVVVSVRLHGALQALLAGWPAIHLSYQRKGWGAYKDLGLEAYVHDARSFDPDVVARQVTSVRSDPHAYFERLRSAAPDLRAMSAQLDRQLQTTLNRT